MQERIACLGELTDRTFLKRYCKYAIYLKS